MEKVSYRINKDLLTDFTYNVKFYCHFVKNIHLSGEDIVLEIEAETQELTQKYKNIVHAVFENISSKKVIKKRELYRNDCRMNYSGDINRELFSRGLIIEYSPGIIGYKGLYLSLYKAFDRLFSDIARVLHAEEIQFPTLLSIKDMDSCHYIENFAHHLTYAAHLQEDMDKIRAYVRKRGMCEMADVEYILGPAACLHSYIMHKNSVIESGKSPLVLTAKGNCFRYESGNLDSFIRLWNFSMREIIFIGSENEVEDLRQQSMRMVQELVEELHLNCFIESANDPFFLGDEKHLDFLQRIKNLKYELRLALPTRETSVAAASFNIHGDHFGKSYNITFSDSSHLHTACTAFGVERWVYGFLSQYGFETSQWPTVIKDII
jgi:seryl-tRNA synthetase